MPKREGGVNIANKVGPFVHNLYGIVCISVENKFLLFAKKAKHIITNVILTGKRFITWNTIFVSHHVVWQLGLSLTWLDAVVRQGSTRKFIFHVNRP
jgi:hypothetical protein